jgi:hypothetical protein
MEQAKPTIAVRCTCKHEYQDARYGQGNRVATPVDGSRVNGKLTEARCTVCGTTHKV